LHAFVASWSRTKRYWGRNLHYEFLAEVHASTFRSIGSHFTGGHGSIAHEEPVYKYRFFFIAG
jgi:hypothetical protein